MYATTTAERFEGYFEGNNDGGFSCRGDGYVDATWDDVGYSWDPANADHSANVNGSWQEDLNEIQSMTQNIYEFRLGSAYKNTATCVGGYIYVDRFVIISGYKQQLPTNW